MKLAKVLFFVAGNMPTQEDFEAAADLKATVSFRNASAILPDGYVEVCDGVAGEVPESYAHLPTAAEAIKTATAKFKAMAQKTGDTAPPKRSPIADVEKKAAPAWTPNAK